MTEITAGIQQQSRLLHSKAFDTLLIAGTTLLAVSTWAAVHLDSDLFYPILVADLWLLGYHHVIATYTRIGADWQMALAGRQLPGYLRFVRRQTSGPST
ncbi:MAG: hypothetical protein PF630_06030 [Gammaproteobacteria bacterium]|jgi:hypothetical protein|nr:hypothetical protein [Gammaproteobacteria bacterium]